MAPIAEDRRVKGLGAFFTGDIKITTELHKLIVRVPGRGHKLVQDLFDNSSTGIVLRSSETGRVIVDGNPVNRKVLSNKRTGKTVLFEVIHPRKGRWENWREG